MSRHLETAVELQRALDALKLAEERLQGIPDWMRDLHEEHSGKKQEIEGLEAQIEEAAVEHRTAAAGVEDHQERLKTFQAQISQVRNQREYGALLHEIDVAKEAIRKHEEQGLEALERQEEARKGLAELRESFQELDDRYAAELEKWEAEKPSVAGQIEKLKSQIETLRERLPRDLLFQFERIFERYDGQALTEVQKVERVGKRPQIWHCSTCNYRVRPQAIVEIMNHGKIVACDSCKKILYLGETVG